MKTLYSNKDLVSSVQKELSTLIDLEYIFETESSPALMLFDVMSDVSELTTYETISIFFDCFSSEYLTRGYMAPLEKLTRYLQGAPSSIDIPLDHESIQDFLGKDIFKDCSTKEKEYIRVNFAFYIACHIHAARVNFEHDGATLAK